MGCITADVHLFGDVSSSLCDVLASIIVTGD